MCNFEYTAADNDRDADTKSSNANEPTSKCLIQLAKDIKRIKRQLRRIQDTQVDLQSQLTSLIVKREMKLLERKEKKACAKKQKIIADKIRAKRKLIVPVEDDERRSTVSSKKLRRKLSQT